ncbi:MAG: hypothetical protein PHR77_16265 [Kiritimatiellae bacterium]|nr:hypothetical protein [Kiritimatiellia bacterium]MDD5521130.1 hypothetical protein [Kiritimatiellia bacterium]
MKKMDVSFVTALGLAIGLPLCGVMIDGKSLWQYTEFPPLTMYVQHADFSWPVFIGLAVFILIVVVPLLLRIILSAFSFADSPVRLIPVSFFPWWGWLGVAFGIVTWILAWTRLEWFAPFQRFTFSPLWFAYILVVNALTFWRTGRCMLINRTGYFLRLFPLSAVFWWFFECLNRFVQNWCYQGLDGLSALQYFIFATLPFSTVLPAVMGTYDLLQSFPRFSAGLNDFARIEVKHPKVAAMLTLVAFGFGLGGIGVWPDYLFPLLWLSPLLIITSIQALKGGETIFTGVKDGNWRKIFLLAMSALICGIFWEMWNYYSFAKWIYMVPFVNRFHIFEMPILGFAGYLPFGLECAVISVLVEGIASQSKSASKEKEATMKDLDSGSGSIWGRYFSVCKYINAIIIIVIAVYFFIVPGFIILKEVYSPDIRKPGIPALAWKMHHDLSPGFEKWARARIASGKAAHLALHDVPSTEWPMFCSVFYLMATENLQKEWEKDKSLAPVAPQEYAKKSIDAAIDLVMDPIHHTWVKQHWGPNYLHRENVFFRSLIINGITSHERLMKDGKFLDVLRDQVLTLAIDLDGSKFGVLDDYPGECYPIDVFASIAWIKDAGQLLDIDNSAFIKRSIRAFQGQMLDERGLPPFVMDSWTGKFLASDFGEKFRCSRGVGNSWVLIFARDLWPDIAEKWYDAYEKYFWQDKWWANGFREFPNDMPGLNYTFDVDCGPVIAGFSPAANAFGVAAARANGRFDHAYMLTAQVLASCWPLIDGTMLGARILSSQAHSPYLGEAAICYFLTQQPVDGTKIVTGGHMPVFVFILVVVYYWGMGVLAICSTINNLRRWKRDQASSVFPVKCLQIIVWAGFYLAGLLMICLDHIGAGIITVLFAQFLPKYRLDKCNDVCRRKND